MSGPVLGLGLGLGVALFIGAGAFCLWSLAAAPAGPAMEPAWVPGQDLPEAPAAKARDELPPAPVPTVTALAPPSPGSSSLPVLDETEGTALKVEPIQQEYPGEAVRGLQLVAKASQYAVTPGDTVSFSLKFINQTPQPVRFLYAAPEVYLSPASAAKGATQADLDSAARVYGGGRALPRADQCRDIPPGGAATYSYSFTWPRTSYGFKKTRAYSARAGLYRVTLVYQAYSPASCPKDAPPAFWQGQLRSGVMPVLVRSGSRVKGRAPAPAEEDF